MALVGGLPAAIEDDHSEARMGNVMCGMVENVPSGAARSQSTRYIAAINAP